MKKLKLNDEQSQMLKEIHKEVGFIYYFVVMIMVIWGLWVIGTLIYVIIKEGL